ncbi:MAG: hypothetical protein R3C49_12795 [Planctomycetaceae bacterium]
MDTPETAGNVKWVAMGTVTASHQGPLSVVIVDDTRLTVVTVLRRQDEIRIRIRKGEDADSVTSELSELFCTRRDIPVEAIGKLEWRDGVNTVHIHYFTDGDQKTQQACLWTERDRSALVQVIADRSKRKAREFLEPAGLLEVTWNYIFGVVASLLCSGPIVLMWDPVMFQQVRGGNIALWLGKPGCAAVGVIAALLCCREGWKATHPFPIRHRWVF